MMQEKEVPKRLNGDHLVGANKRFLCYIRATECKPASEQRGLIERFCKERGLRLVGEFIDKEVPGSALSQALKGMSEADGIIVSDLNRFVEHSGHRNRELRPVLHHFMADHTKHLISIAEGIDTSTVSGQQIAMESINQLKDADEDAHSCWFDQGCK